METIYSAIVYVFVTLTALVMFGAMIIDLMETR